MTVETTIQTDTPMPAEAHELGSLPLGSGTVTVDLRTGNPVQFIDDRAPARTFLLDETVAWHNLEHAWGSGYVIAEGLAGRWNAPESIQHTPTSVESTHRIGEQLTVSISRIGGDTLLETYRFRNTGPEPLRITSIGIQTPYADLYPGARDSLERMVHAHLFTGGSWSWVAAQPMSGAGRILGLAVREGALWGYSVETRNANTISNARGHLVLNVTDHARNEDAFGGQPVIEVPAGDEYVLSWELAWYEDMASFLAATAAPATFSALSVGLGEAIAVETTAPVTAQPGVTVTVTATGAQLIASKPGSYWVGIGDAARTEVLFHDTVEATVRRRSAYALAHQRSTERPGLLGNAFVPVDTKTHLTQLTNGWSDWTDGSERIGMAWMLQHALSLGWVDSSVDEILEGWAAFARAHLIDESGAPRRGSQDAQTGIRLYDSPWLAHFFLLRHRHNGSAADLALAAKLIERALELGAGTLLTISFSEVTVAVATALADNGDLPRAESLRSAIVASGRHFAAAGADLPNHEVAYEQSITAPLVATLIEAYNLSGDPTLLEAIEARLPWLLAFSGAQPHARLHGVAIRHWDGYWFGQRRQWGDVFPHYWSVLTASVLLKLPESLQSAETGRLADAILRANMANYFPDGSATCAFVMPTSVDGQPAHAADPLANDQDFHLAIWMQLAADGFTTLL